MKMRLERLRQEMETGGEAVCLVTEGKNRRYLSGFTGSSGWLVVTPHRCLLITDGRYWEQVASQSPDLEVFRFQPATHKTLTGALVDLLTGHLHAEPSGSAIAVEIDDMPVSLYRNLQTSLNEAGFSIRDIEGRVKKLRALKDPDEVSCMRRAAEIADLALSAALEVFHPGMTEAALKAEIDYQVLLRGGEGAAFPTIVASGVNGSFPHAGASDKTVLEGELITVDFGAIWKGYCSDMTRTIWFGEISDELKRYVDEVSRAQSLAVSAARPGLSTGALDAVARDHLKAAGLGEYFIHSLGHGVGLDVHEAPTLRSGQEDLLSEGQAITIEPGIYLPGKTGCRVEDTIVLGATSNETLNLTPKQGLSETQPPRLPPRGEGSLVL